MITSAHKINLQNHVISMYFSCPNFNGKAPRKGNRTPMNQDKYSEEGDWESGFHCYGARYYWSEVLTGWLSVDPMADKYPSISPYAYCNWNPVKLVDPEGEEAMDNDDEWKYNTTTKKIEWLNGNGGSTHQTVTLTSGDGNHESFNSMVSYNGVIEDMFDFNVFSNQTDNIVDGGANILGGVTTCVGGVALAVATEGAATNIAVPIAMTGGAQVGFRINC